MFSEYRILSWPLRLGLETAIVSGLSLGRRTLSFNLGRLTSGTVVGEGSEGEAALRREFLVPPVTAASFPPPVAPIPFSVAILYLRILALEMRDVK